MPQYFAHSSPNGNPPPNGWQLLRDHLAGVAALAKELAKRTGVPELPAAAEAVGWLHDLGKYRESFQLLIRGLPPLGSKQHKEAGAAYSMQKGNLPLAFAILGHHVGIPNPDDAKIAIKGEDGVGVVNKIESIAVGECHRRGRKEIRAEQCVRE